MLLRTLERARRASTHGHRQFSVRLLNAKVWCVRVYWRAPYSNTVLTALLYSLHSFTCGVARGRVLYTRSHTGQREGQNTVNADRAVARELQ